MQRTFTLFLVIPTIAIPYLPSDFDDDLPETRHQLRSIHEIGKAVVGALKARDRTDDQIVDVLEYVIEHPDEFPDGSSGNAAGAMGLRSPIVKRRFFDSCCIRRPMIQEGGRFSTKSSAAKSLSGGRVRSARRTPRR